MKHRGANIRKIRDGFTMVELLVVVIIIAILIGLTLSIVGNVTTSAKKSRASGEVAAMDLALSRFQVDNGFYPAGTNISFTVTTPAYYSPNPSSAAATNMYKMANRALFLALTGRTMYNYAGTNTNTYRQYYTDLKANQVGDAGLSNTNAASFDPTVQTTYTTNSFSSGSYFQDPFQNPYGYYYNPGTGSNPGYDMAGDVSLYNRTSPDIWSTAGETNATFTTANRYLVLRWIHNWPQNANP